MKTKRKPVRRLDKDSFANKNRKVSDFPEVNVGHLDDVVPGSCFYDSNPVDGIPVVDTGNTVPVDKVKTNISAIYTGESFCFQETQPVSNVTEHSSRTSYCSTNLTINEPDPVSTSVAIDQSIGKGKRKIDDLYNSSIDAFIAGSQVPKDHIPSLESVVCNVTADTSFHSKGCSSSMPHLNNVNNNVHINEFTHAHLSTLPGIEDASSSPAFTTGSQSPKHHIPFLESVVCNVTADTSFHSKGFLSTLPGIQDACSYPGQTTGSNDQAIEIFSDTNTENISIRAPSEPQNCAVQMPTEITNTANVTTSFNAQPARNRCYHQHQIGATSSNVRHQTSSTPVICLFSFLCYLSLAKKAIIQV